MTRSTISVSVDRLCFDALAGRLARDEDADLLLSAPGYPSETTSFIGVRPVDELVFTPETTPERVKAFCFDSPGPAFGFVSYDFGLSLRGVHSDKPRTVPLGRLRKYAAEVRFDPATQRVEVASGDRLLLDELVGRLEAVRPVAPDTVGQLVGPPHASLDRTAYEAGVTETLERILAGDVYQLNLSTRLAWDCPDLDPLALFLALYSRHPAPFYGWFGSGRHRVLSTSPERFLRVADGQVLSQPIKGTLRFEAYDPALAERLVASPKEAAELSMIVDLVRNDISTDCAYGTVRVDNHQSVFAVDDLLQMYSDVGGELRPDRDCLDLFFSAFPGGSVTGCPKQSAMTIIEALEPHARGVYCGSFLLVDDEGTMDSSIAIRTAVYDTQSGVLETFAGSGIVVDSDPAAEYEETMAKAAKFLTLGDS